MVEKPGGQPPGSSTADKTLGKWAENDGLGPSFALAEPSQNPDSQAPVNFNHNFEKYV
jgi:hypothetical protein